MKCFQINFTLINLNTRVVRFEMFFCICNDLELHPKKCQKREINNVKKYSTVIIASMFFFQKCEPKCIVQILIEIKLIQWIFYKIFYNC